MFTQSHLVTNSSQNEIAQSKLYKVASILNKVLMITVKNTSPVYQNAETQVEAAW